MHTRAIARASIGLAMFLGLATGFARLGRSADDPASTGREPPHPLPECPKNGEWSPVFAALFQPPVMRAGRLGTAGPVPSLPTGASTDVGFPPPQGHPGVLAGAGVQTDVPEFNDCQQFISGGSAKPRFISLFAIFANQNLAKASLDSVKAHPSTLGYPMGEIFAFDSAYAPLGIARGFTCLYFYFPTSAATEFKAVTIPVAQELECASPHDVSVGAIAQSHGLLLDVKRDTVAPNVPLDVPAVARWDWDPVNKAQYIGIKCGNAWCEVGNQHLDFSHVNAPPTLDFFTASLGYKEPAAPPSVRRVVEIKGWYDQQRLAGVGPAGPVVTDVVGTLIPDKDLGVDIPGTPPGSSRFNGQWIPTAQVAISKESALYQRKLNLFPSSSTAGPQGPPTPTNVVSLCYSKSPGPNACFGPGTSPPTCAKSVQAPHDWWAKIVAANGQTTKYFCVTRRAHPNFMIPGIVRWRWTIADDTIWIRCIDGCCEVEPDGGT
jgi:hypothetical protein